MIEVLQRYSVYNLTGLLGLVLLFWLVWPVLCGVLGARRGQGLQGVIHGLLWGPAALPIVLLSGRKHVCPTCGKRTLSQPVEPERTAWSMPPPVSPDASEPPSDRVTGVAADARFVETPVVVERRSCTAKEAPHWRLMVQTGEDCSEEQAARLRAWVNSEDPGP